MYMRNWIKLVISIAVPQVVALSGAFFTITGTGSWYQNIAKPSWNPPNWVFGPVWTLLYLLMGIALFIIWKSENRDKRTAIIFWVIQLALNFLWTILFFNQHQILGAFIEMILLWIMILMTIIYFARISKLAAWLMVPYIAWVSFAALLNYAIWQLNQ
jgi:tryptophan-rich sensory protein